MRLQARHRFWVALAILPLIGGFALASGPAMFVCRGDLVARTACCCPVGEHAAPASRGAAPSLSAACCCDVSQMTAPVTPAVAESRVPAQLIQHLDLVPVATLAIVAAPASAQSWIAARVAHPPPAAIPILLSKQSFLV
jgi:hypothetical protein